MGEPDPEHDAFLDFVERAQHEGESALVRGDVEPRLAMWSHHDPVTLFAAVGPTKAGWAALEPTFRAVASRLSGGRDVRYDLLAMTCRGMSPGARGSPGSRSAWTAARKGRS